MSTLIYQAEGKICLQCQNTIPKYNKFCDRSCAAKYNNANRSQLSRSLQAASLKKTVDAKIANGTFIFPPKADLRREQRQCPICEKLFTVRPSNPKKVCSMRCHAGGYREGSGRSKTGYYQGHYCGSTYELAWIIYQLDHHQQFQRFPGYLTDGSLKYYPDFLLPNNTIIEIKGYHTDLVDQKTELAKSKGYDIKVLYKDDLKEVFVYVSTKYQIPQSKFYTLYEIHG